MHATSPERFCRIDRVVSTYSEEPYRITQFVPGTDRIERGGHELSVDYILTRVPLDCIDDISRSGDYNPRHLKESHRDDLMDQIGTYGLIQPLIGTIDSWPEPSESRRLFLIDGRHRYNGLLWLDPRLQRAISQEAQRQVEAKESSSISDPRDLSAPRGRSLEVITRYSPDREGGGQSGDLPSLVPIKIYIGRDDVQRIGMAVFLNRGQKALAGGEEISKIAVAFGKALADMIAHPPTEGGMSEARAVERVVQTGSRADAPFVVVSRHVAAVMNDEDSPWFPVVGRWQTETFPRKGLTYWKPLTAGNFHAFVARLVNSRPMDVLDEAQRDREVWNLNKLGDIFATVFGWPEDIPNTESPYTSTSTLCRSFLIRALAEELNERFGPEGGKLLSNVDIKESIWKGLQSALEDLRANLRDQTDQRIRFEDLKKQLQRLPTEETPERRELLISIDEARGRLWTLDTVIPALQSRIGQVLGPRGGRRAR